MLKIINITIFFLLTAFFHICKGQENTLLLHNYKDSLSVSGTLVNKIDHMQYYYFLPEILSDKSSVISEIHLMSGFSAFYFNTNGIRSFSAINTDVKRTPNGRVIFIPETPGDENIFTYTLFKEDFNGFYGQLKAGYLVHGLTPFNSESDLLEIYYARSDFKELHANGVPKDSLHSINANAFLLLSPLADVQRSENLTIIKSGDISSLRLEYIRNLITDAKSIWYDNFALDSFQDFTVILDTKAGTRSPFLANGVVLHPSLPRRELTFEILTALSTALVMEKNPKINQEDLLRTSLTLILQYYEATEMESVKSDLYIKISGYQDRIDKGIVSTGKRLSRLDREMVIVKMFKEITSVPQKERSEFIRFNLTQQYFQIDKTGVAEGLISPGYPGNRLKGYLLKIINPPIGQAGFIPIPGYNVYDGLMAGGVLRWRRYINADFIPMYSFKNKTLNGIYHLKKEIVLSSESSFRSIAPFVNFRNFAFRNFVNNPFILQYNRFSAGLDLHFASERNRFSGHQERIRLNYIIINEETLNYNSDNEFVKENIPFALLRMNYINSQEESVNPFHFSTGIEYGNYSTSFGRQQYIKLEGSYQNTVPYNPGKYVFYRFYLGFFPFNSQENSSNVNTILTRGSLSIFNRGFSDYGYDELLINRGNDGFTAQQIFGNRGNFKIPAGSFFTYGQSNKFLFSGNFLLDLPFTGRYFPLKPFIDIAYVMDNTPVGPNESDEFYYTGGVALEWGKHFGLYYPFFYSGQIGIILAESGDTGNTFKNYLSRLSFRIDLMELLKL